MASARIVHLVVLAGLMGLGLQAIPADAQQGEPAATQIDVLRDQARQGSLAAKLALGLAYDLGRGVMQDEAKAFGWYLEAAKAGDPTGQFNVGVMLDAGVGVPVRDLVGARQWYTRAAANGQPRAQYNLGLMYAQGDGVPQNPELSQAWFARAATALPAAAAKLEIVDPPSDPALLRAPVTAFGALVAIDRGLFAELGWTADRGPAGAVFLVETAVWVPALADWLFPVQSVETRVSGVTIDLRGVSDQYAWRVSLIVPSSGRYASTSWKSLNAADLSLPPDDVAPQFTDRELSRGSTPDMP